MAISVTMLAVAVHALRLQLAKIEPKEVISHIRSIPTWRIFLAVLTTVLNYLQLTFYDVLGLRYVRRELRYTIVAPASFVATTFGHNIGVPFVSGGSVRYRFYSEHGLSAGEIARLVGFISITFVIGYACVAGMMLVGVSQDTKLPVPPGVTGAAGFAALTLVGGYFALSAIGVKSIPLRGKQLAYPQPLLAAAQVLVAGIDWLAMAAVLWLLLPCEPREYRHLLQVVLISQMVGVVSQVPGGLGVFESIMVEALVPTMPLPTVLGTLIVYRLIYYLFPFGVAIVGLAGYELWALLRRARNGSRSPR